MSGELLQQQVDYVTDLYDTLCPEWMNVYEWIGDKSLVGHATNALCTSIGEESQEQLKADYSAVSSTSDLWLRFALFAKMRLWFLWESNDELHLHYLSKLPQEPEPHLGKCRQEP